MVRTLSRLVASITLVVAIAGLSYQVWGSPAESTVEQTGRRPGVAGTLSSPLESAPTITELSTPISGNDAPALLEVRRHISPTLTVDWANI